MAVEDQHSRQAKAGLPHLTELFRAEYLQNGFSLSFGNDKGSFAEAIERLDLDNRLVSTVSGRLAIGGILVSHDISTHYRDNRKESLSSLKLVDLLRVMQLEFLPDPRRKWHPPLASHTRVTSRILLREKSQASVGFPAIVLEQSTAYMTDTPAQEVAHDKDIDQQLLRAMAGTLMVGESATTTSSHFVIYAGPLKPTILLGETQEVVGIERAASYDFCQSMLQS